MTCQIADKVFFLFVFRRLGKIFPNPRYKARKMFFDSSSAQCKEFFEE